LDNSGSRLNTVIQNSQRLVVIHNFIEEGVQYDTLESLSTNYLSETFYAAEWSSYDGWEETGRQITADAVIIDFDLKSLGVSYLGRDIISIRDGWMYVTRLVVPANNRALLDLLQSLAVPAFRGYPDMQKLPRNWPIYVDQQLGFALKYPPGWQIVAGNPGNPVTITTPQGQTEATVRVWTIPDRQIDSPEAAEALVTEIELTATIQGSAPVERQQGVGYQAAYQYQDAAGDWHSGLLVALNDEPGTLFIANLHLDAPDLNLLDASSLDLLDNEARQVVAEGFIALPINAREVPTPAIESTEEPTAEAE